MDLANPDLIDKLGVDLTSSILAHGPVTCSVRGRCGYLPQSHHLALGHQLCMLERSVKRPKLTKADRLFWAELSRFWADWRAALVMGGVRLRLWRAVVWGKLPRAIADRLSRHLLITVQASSSGGSRSRSGSSDRSCWMSSDGGVLPSIQHTRTLSAIWTLSGEPVPRAGAPARTVRFIATQLMYAKRYADANECSTSRKPSQSRKRLRQGSANAVRTPLGPCQATLTGG